MVIPTLQFCQDNNTVKQRPCVCLCVHLRCLDYVLDEIALSGNANVMVASHNEDTVKHTLRRYGFNSQHTPLKNTHIFCTQPRICINQVINYSSLSLSLSLSLSVSPHQNEWAGSRTDRQQGVLWSAAGNVWPDQLPIGWEKHTHNKLHSILTTRHLAGWFDSLSSPSVRFLSAALPCNSHLHLSHTYIPGSPSTTEWSAHAGVHLQPVTWHMNWDTSVLTSCLNKALLLAPTTLFVSQRQTEWRQAVVYHREAQVETLTGIDVNRHTCVSWLSSQGGRAASAGYLKQFRSCYIEIFIIRPKKVTISIFFLFCFQIYSSRLFSFFIISLFYGLLAIVD